MTAASAFASPSNGGLTTAISVVRTSHPDTSHDRHHQQQAGSPYELAVEGHLAAACYSLADGVITFRHTEVPPELGGKGIGSKLIKGALAQVRADGLKVIAQCPFVKGYIEKHPEYADLVQV